MTNETANRSLRILIVDDNVDAADMLSMLLEVGGNTTRIEHTGNAGLAAVRDFEPDVVFLDIGLPDLSGHEIASRLRADPSLRRQPVLVAITGWGREDDRRQSRAAGFDQHLVKPVDHAKLNNVLAMARDQFSTPLGDPRAPVYRSGFVTSNKS